jgi:hypothetical protein
MSCSNKHRYNHFVGKFLKANPAEGMKAAAKAWKSMSAEEKSAHTP